MILQIPGRNIIYDRSKCGKVGFSGYVARGSALPIKTTLPKSMNLIIHNRGSAMDREMRYPWEVQEELGACQATWGNEVGIAFGKSVERVRASDLNFIIIIIAFRLGKS